MRNDAPDALGSLTLERQQEHETRPDRILEIMESVAGGFHVRGNP